ncbi:endonuclease/exonuclease/phosphatase family protein [Pseudonocardiaceae bacterium YIM PH 21723]|nr:endonuclease/exonuclease/phosphatase family protein [Pseudonocardiaceae bacterium YIM PH 21723]
MLVLLPDLLGLDRWAPFAQLAAFRPALLLITVPVLGVLAWRRRWWLVALTAPVWLIGVALTVPRLIPVDLPQGREITVLSANLSYAQVPQDYLVRIIRDRRPDLVSLPESGQSYVTALAGKLPGYRAFAESTDANWRTGLLVADHLGTPRTGVDTETNFATLSAELPGLTFVAFHAFPPLSRTGRWRHDLAELSHWCAKTTPTIIAGDFNATLDHGPFRAAMRGCRDAASDTGTGLVPTWPAELPAVQIDHVLSAGGPVARRVEVLDLPGSDHRALVVTMALPIGS